MVAPSRHTKVLVVLLVSMAFGAIFLRSLGYHPPSAGAFCLSDYHRLMPVKTIVLCRTIQTAERWQRIEVCRAPESVERQMRGSSDSETAVLSDQSGRLNTSCHFVVCNGRIGGDGQIIPTEKWTRQEPADRGPHQDERTILICVVTDGPTDRPTNYQMKRTETLVVELCRRLGIQSKSVRYPDNWW
jgi:hypothetical protein